MKNALLKFLLIGCMACGFCNANAQTNIEVCSGDPGNMVADVLTDVPDGFEWQLLGADGTWATYIYGTIIDIGFQNYSFTNTTKALQVYHLRRQVTSEGIPKYDSFYDITVDPVIDKNGIAAYRTILCIGDNDPVSFTGDKVEGYNVAPQYTWQESYDNVGWNDVDEDNKQQSINYHVKKPQPVYLRRITVVNKCSQISNVIQLTPLAATTIAVAGKDQILCNQTQVTLDANKPAEVEHGEWSVISPDYYNPFNTSNSQNSHLTIDNLPLDVDVKLQWTLSNPCLQLSESTVIIHSYSTPIVEAGHDVTIERGGRTTLQGNIVSKDNYTYRWTPETGLSDPNSLNPVASPVSTTVYTLSAKFNAGCDVSKQVTVAVNVSLGIPDAFTPNGDGINDKWVIKNIEIYPTAQVYVYSRNGGLVFHSKGYPVPWDGTTNGKKLPPGVYYYAILIDEIQLKQGGSLTIIK